MDYYDAEVENLVVIYDDLDLPTGKIRLREKGGHGGHNGIRPLIDHLGTKEFIRVGLGIGRPEGQMAVVGYVLQNFQKDELPAVKESIHRAMDAVECFITDSFKEAMNTFN